jgi:ethanolamine ammonia-lyase small subunit
MKLEQQLAVPSPCHLEGYLQMLASTRARIGISRAGTRVTTEKLLRFRGDHANAQDSVNTAVPESWVHDNGFLDGTSQCTDLDMYLRHPEKGRELSPASGKRFSQDLTHDAQVLLAVGDGLSSAAICASSLDTIASLKQGLSLSGISIGKIPFIRFCRVGIMDELAPLLGAQVVCLLIGERPGLGSATSMSAYMAYRPDKTREESWRTVISNIHEGGIPPVEAGAQIAEVLVRMLRQKCSGIALIHSEVF